MKSLGKINTLSNYLSLLRLLMAVPIWFSMQYHVDSDPFYLASLLCLAAALTDYYDGYFARKMNQITEWGKILDPLADKVVIAVVVLQFYLHNRLDLYIILIVIGRDVLILLAGMALSKRIDKVLPSNTFGKITVTVIAVYLFFIALRLDYKFENANVLLYLAVIFTSVASLIAYAQRSIEFMQRKKRK